MKKETDKITAKVSDSLKAKDIESSRSAEFMYERGREYENVFKSSGWNTIEAGQFDE